MPSYSDIYCQMELYINSEAYFQQFQPDQSDEIVEDMNKNEKENSGQK